MPPRGLKKKQPSLWPWLVGTAVLGLILWGVSDLLRAPEGEERPPIPTALEDTFPPAAIPRPPDAAVGMGVPGVEELAPLNESHVGQVVRVEGEVLATGTTGFWILAGEEVLRVDSDRVVRKNDSIAVQGILRQAEGERTDQMASEVLSRSPRSDGWRVVRDVKLVEAAQSTQTGGPEGA